MQRFNVALQKHTETTMMKGNSNHEVNIVKTEERLFKPRQTYLYQNFNTE